ncbi:MAG TPA: acyltransferase [Caulobacteraceae bacterium]|nr:acyltransferase [Caulobacteraceae bacterium]
MAEPAPAEAHAAPASYPTQITPLIGLRFFALAWVILNQFRFHLDLHAGDRSGIVFKGYLGAALFFVLTGFLTAHLFTTDRADGRFRYGASLWAKLAGFYPLHLAAIAAMGGLLIAGHAIGAPPPQGLFDAKSIAANLGLVQAWGVMPTVSWNFPSWLISAEWFAALAFPLTAWIALGRINPVAVIAVALASFATMFEIADYHHVLFTDMTAQIGALQTVPAFLFGAGLYAFGRRASLPGGWAKPLAALAAAWIVAAALMRLSDLAIWPVFGVLVFALAETSKTPKPALSQPAVLYLGAAAMSLYLVYLPVDIAYFHGVERLVGTPTGARAWAVWAGVFPVILAVGLVAYQLITRPAAAWLEAHSPFALLARRIARPAETPAT